MPTCEVCGEVVYRLYTCADCGIKFCKECGDPDPEKKLCALCARAPRDFRILEPK